jgi:hypothetical protein
MIGANQYAKEKMLEIPPDSKLDESASVARASAAESASPIPNPERMGYVQGLPAYARGIEPPVEVLTLQRFSNSPSLAVPT